MGSCTRRHFLLSICVLQLLSICERQVFDFLGYMWAPILVNFFHIIFVIFGFFGAYQYRPKYLVTYSLWNLLWIAWNSFLICFYLNIGLLDRDGDLLNLGTGSVSWFEVNGYGCKPTYPINITSEDPYRLVRPEKVEGCILEYHIIEIIHSMLQNMLAILGLIGAICIGQTYLEEDDSSSKNSKKAKHRQSLYSIEFSRPVDAIRGHHSDILDTDLRDQSLSPKPMTPRRVKRRSVMQRGTNSRQSTQSRRSHSSNRNSVRNSRRKVHQNPVTKLMNQQSAGTMTLTKTFPSFANQNKIADLTESNLKSLNNDYVLHQSTPALLNNLSNQVPKKNKNLNTFSNPNVQQHSPIDPIYYNMNASSPLLQQQTSWASTALSPTAQGHSNPTYLHSTTNLNHSPELNEYSDYVPHRPPSVRSSYSNFHGTRPVSSYIPQPTSQLVGTNGENVFVGLQPKSEPMPVPQMPDRRTMSRESLQSMHFLKNGPPAYNLNYHTPPDSETTM